MTVDLTWTKQDNSSDGDWEIYRSDDGTLGSEITGGLSVSTTSYTDSTVDDGKEYFYTLRRNTDHASTDSNQVSILTDIPTPTDFSVTVDKSKAEVTGTWTDDVTGEDGWQPQVSRDGGSTWEDVGPQLAANSTSFTENYIAANPTDWRVKVITEDSSGTSNTDSLTETLAVDDEGLNVKLVDSAHNVRDLVDRGDAAPTRLDVAREHTGLSDFSGDVALANGENFLTTWKSRLTEVYAYSDSTLFFRGFLPITETATDATQTRVEGPDVIDLLRRGEQQVTYQNISNRDAIADYWQNHTNFSATVQAANPETVVSNEDVFQADTTTEFQNETSLSDTDPFTIQSDQVELEQTAFTVEGENADRETGTLSSTNTDRYSNGDAVVFDDSASAEYDFTLNYDVPSGSFSLPFRVDIPSDGTDPHALLFEIDINQTGSFDSLAKFNFAPINDPEWFDLSGQLAQDDGVTFKDPGRIPAGSHTIRISTGQSATNTETFISDWNTFVPLEFDDITNGSETVTTTDGDVTFTGGGDDYTMDYSAGEIKVEFTGDMENNTEYEITYDYTSNVGSETIAIDVLAPLADARQTYTIDNTLDSNQGALDGPELYPTAGIDLDFNLQDLPFNITDVIIDTTWNDTTEGQAIAASNDGGTTFTTSNNTADDTLTPSTVGTELVFRATLSGFGSQTTTPKTGINGQILSFVDVDYNGSDLAVIDDQTFRESDFRNLQRLHRDANFRWEVDYKEESLEVESYPKGTSGTASWRTKNARLVGDEEEYANRVVVNGKGTARAVVQDDAEISAKGETITVTRTDTTKTTDNACKSLARSILSEVTENDKLTGDITTPPTDIPPGKRYTVPIFNNRDLDLETVRYTLENGSLTGSLSFAVDPVLARQAADRETSIQDTKESI